MNLNLLKVFVKVAELGSYSKASKVLKIPKSKVSRSVSQLEEEIGFQLLKRTTRHTSLTESGRELYHEVTPKLDQIQNKIESLSERKDKISGVISLTAPFDFGEFYLTPIMSEFLQLYPLIEFKIHLSDSYLDLVSFDIDLAIRMGNLKDSTLKRTVIGYSQKVLVASPHYLKMKGTPKNTSELSKHKILSFYNDNQLDPLSSLYQDFGVKPTVRSNSFPLLKSLALNSQGIAVLPNLICKDELKMGKLVQILPNWNQSKTFVQVVNLPNKNESVKLKLFKDFLVKKLGNW